MFMNPAALKYTYGDYLALPHAGPRYQLLDGDLILSPSPSLRHQRIVGRLFAILFAHVRSAGLGEVFCAPLDVRLSDVDTPQPDLVFVSRAHAERLGPRGILGPPDLVVEVLSEDRDIDIHLKRKLYGRHGVPEYWIVDPDTRVVYLYQLLEDPASPPRIYTALETLESPSFPGLRISLSEILSP
jgi:Uma2 family endonuclease